ncbi:DNA-processing protein DprA [Peribacillus sp. NPDC060253]|uniref:DNA-processing protein DprA n=1 Tax=Peribacillus sp. NPDC060253 TaxID=3347084 RepID=UPI00366363F2
MQFNENQIATYLLCAKLPNAKTPPLTIIEWNELIRALKEHNLEPKNLLGMTPSEILNIGSSKQKMMKMAKKIEDRQKLGFSMMELEELSNQGYKIMFRQNIPKRLKGKIDPKHLPPFFYVIGDTSIFEYLALGVVGSRDANKEEIANTARLGHEAAIQGIVLVSGGAKGIDSTAVDACLNNGGKAIVFPSEGLESWIKRKEIRQYIQNKQLLLISAQSINARFTGAYAMQRNKYIHTTAHAVLVASSKILSSRNTKTGTWSGVMENVQAQWTPIFVQGKSEGVQKLLEEGHAKPFDSFASLLAMAKPNNASKNTNQIVKPESTPFPRQEILQYLRFAKDSGLNEQQVREELTLLMKEVFDNSLEQIRCSEGALDDSNEQLEVLESKVKKNPENKGEGKEIVSPHKIGLNNESVKDTGEASSEQISIEDLLIQDKNR